VAPQQFHGEVLGPALALRRKELVVQDSLVLLAAGAGLVQLLPLLVIFSLFFLLVFRPKSMTYALEPGGPKRLKISWSRTFKNIQILFDDQPLGSFPDKNAFKAGGRFPLPDGSALDLKFVEGLGYAEVQISRNGIPLPGAQRQLDLPTDDD
jgi:hypothetical protein